MGLLNSCILKCVTGCFFLVELMLVRLCVRLFLQGFIGNDLALPVAGTNMAIAWFSHALVQL